MLDFLHKICESNKLVVHDFNCIIDIPGLNAKIAIPSDINANQEYYLIIEYELTSDHLIDSIIKEHLEKLMDSLEGMNFTDESFKKNCTLIFCCKKGEISDQSLLKFEENPYFFKKNVITYSDIELIELKNKLDNNHDNDSLNKLLMANNGDFFELFKKSSLNEDNFYPLLIRIITKLPFVHYVPQQNQLNDLDNFVRGDLSPSNLKLLDIICVDEQILTHEVIESVISSAEWGEK